MGDEGSFDPCECVWGHELAMRRLLSLLRQSQSYCTDTECFQNVVRPQNEAIDNSFLFIMMTVILAIAMLYFRPRSRNSQLDDTAKPHTSNNGTPPTPPPTAF